MILIKTSLIVAVHYRNEEALNYSQ